MAPLLLDGGTGHLLKAQGVERLVPGLQYDQLFLAGALANDLAPEAVLGVHRAYIAAGSWPGWWGARLLDWTGEGPQVGLRVGCLWRLLQRRRDGLPPLLWRRLCLQAVPPLLRLSPALQALT